MRNSTAQRIVLATPAPAVPTEPVRKITARLYGKRKAIALATAMADVQAVRQIAVLLKTHVDRLKTSDGRVDWSEVACAITMALGDAPMQDAAAHRAIASRDGVVHVLAARIKQTVDQHINPQGIVDWVDVGSDLFAWMKDNQK